MCLFAERMKLHLFTCFGAEIRMISCRHARAALLQDGFGCVVLDINCVFCKVYEICRVLSSGFFYSSLVRVFERAYGQLIHQQGAFYSNT